MIEKEKYLVYKPETDTLALNEAEGKLVRALHLSPPIKYKRLINDYLTGVQDISLALERLDEVFSAYYNPAPNLVQLFMGKRKELDVIFEILEGYRLTLNPISISREAQYFKSLFKSEGLHLFVINEFSKPQLEVWFDSQGNFIRKGRGNDNPGAVCDLLTALLDKGYFKQEVEKQVRMSKADLAYSCFNIKVGAKSSNVKGRGKHYIDITRRLLDASKFYGVDQTLLQPRKPGTKT